ncbi:MAG: Lrp/AsnC ligand binding domain-containing protein [Chloroflexi bacterium]|nr:Lrp/AsnC ligand binding domain-containing protein [Chloroflexota bacterium]
MATRAYVLIETAMGKTKDVVGAIQSLEGLKSVNVVTGPYDIIVVMEGKNADAIGQLVTGKIHHIPGVSRTLICLAF